MLKNEKGVFLILLDIYWPALLFGGTQLGFILVRRGTVTAKARLERFLAGLEMYPAWIFLLALIFVLTLLLILLKCCGNSSVPSDREEKVVDVTASYVDESERFPGLNHKLHTEKRHGEPKAVERVFIPRTVPASSAKKSADRLRLMSGDREKLSAPLMPGTHTIRLDGYTVTVTVERNGVEDVTRELPKL